MNEALKRHMPPDAAQMAKKRSFAQGKRKAAIRRKRHIISTIVGKFQTTVPPEIRDLFKLREGDLLEWNFDHSSKTLVVVPMRPQSLISHVDESQDASVEDKDAYLAHEEEPVLVPA